VPQRGRRLDHAVLIVRLAITLAGPSLVHTAGLSRLPGLARHAEDVGIDQLAVPDHVLLGTELDGYPFGRFPELPTSPYPEPLTLLAAVAAVTSRLELAPTTLIAPLRPAVLLAKACATLDVLSGGRLVLGVGTGWHRDEFAAAGVPFAGRGARMDDTMRACRVLWRDSPASFSSPTVSFQDAHCEPRPLHADSIRVWVGGGNAARAAARVADYANGWIPPPAHGPDAVADGVAQIREELQGAGRDPSQLDVKIAIPVRDGDLERSLESAVPALAAAGVTVVQVAVGALVDSPEQVPALLDRLAARFLDYRGPKREPPALPPGL
jgi:probable F420-dependent oxidoreductase